MSHRPSDSTEMTLALPSISAYSLASEKNDLQARAAINDQHQARCGARSLNLSTSTAPATEGELRS